MKISKLKKTLLLGYIFSLLTLFTLCIGFTTGIKGAITWGPTNDFWAMSIAISKIEYGLGGYLGHREVSQELANHLSSTKSDTNVGDSKTKELIQNPQLISEALKKATTLDKNDFKKGDKWSGHYLSYSEDIGFIDYYKIAFTLFGYSAYSSYYLYILLFLLSLITFFLRYYKDTSCMVSALLISVSIFAAANSPLMSDLMISIGSNRFISTLIFIPLIHILNENILIKREFFYKRLILFLIQICFIFFIMTVRISSSWAIITILFIVLLKFLYIYFRNKNFGVKNIFVSKGANYTAIFLIFIVIGFSFKTIQYFKVDKIYHSQDMMPHHLIWHSAYIGLNQHPRWNDFLPYPDLKGAQGDSIPFIVTNNVLKDSGISIVGGAGGSGNSKNRLHDQIIKKQFFKFLYENPRYAFELFFIHKPLAMLSVLESQFKDTKQYAIIYSIFILLFSFFVLLNSKNCKFILTTILLTSLIISVFSTLPILWAYPAPFVLADQYVAFYNLIMSVILSVLVISFNLLFKNKFMIDFNFFNKCIIYPKESDLVSLGNIFKHLESYLKKHHII